MTGNAQSSTLMPGIANLIHRCLRCEQSGRSLGRYGLKSATTVAAVHPDEDHVTSGDLRRPPNGQVDVAPILRRGLFRLLRGVLRDVFHSSINDKGARKLNQNNSPVYLRRQRVAPANYFLSGWRTSLTNEKTTSHRLFCLKEDSAMACTGRLMVVLLCSLPAAAAQSSPPTAPPEKTVEIVPYVTVVYPDPWVVTSRTRSTLELAYPSAGEPTKRVWNPAETQRSGKPLVAANATIGIEVDSLASHADAVKRLALIASEAPESPSFLVIAGWPALERRRTAPLPSPGEGQAAVEGNATFITTAIAADTYLIRFEAVIAPGADPKLADAATSIARNVRVRPGNAQTARAEIETLSKSVAQPRTTLPPAQPRGPTPAPAPPPPGSLQPGAALVQNGLGELEVAVSNDGMHVVVAANSGFSFSDDGGQTFQSGGSIPCIFALCFGDISLAVGNSGAVYLSWVGNTVNEPGPFAPPNGATNTVSVSTDNGHTFKFAGNAVLCPSTTPLVCSAPDQPHVAADRFSLSFAGQDRVYLVWRNFSGLGLTPRIVCSIDGGLTWPEQATIDVSGDFPRVTVGPDGSVFVAYVSGSNIMLRKYTACDAGFNPQPKVVVSTFTNVACPVPGLDRCNDGNVLSSPTASVDPLNANHIYVAWATSTETGNEDIRVAESQDGGLTFPRSVRVNSAVTARRFMPWVCASNGDALVGWYDRRAATTASNDLTAYFAGMVTSGSAGLQVSADVNVSGSSDPQCASGWPCSSRSKADATSCSVQPQLAGTCSQSGNQCNYAAPNCPTGQSCNTGGGCPKYGDYNGVACMAGRLFAAWASATSPPGVAGVTGISIFASSLTLPNPTCPPGFTFCSGSCVDTASDPNNCGACGDVCRFEAPNCVGGRCTGCPLGTQSCCAGEFCRKTCPICP